MEEDLVKTHIELHDIKEMLNDMKPFENYVYAKEYLDSVSNTSPKNVTEEDKDE